MTAQPWMRNSDFTEGDCATTIAQSSRAQQCSADGMRALLVQVKGQFVDLLKEFSAGAHDASEAARCLTEIGARYYHHQLVKSAIELSFAEEKGRANGLLQSAYPLLCQLCPFSTAFAPGLDRGKPPLHGVSLHNALTLW
eukprot:scaffold44923_cov21-Tisochrysis_lutea.AAC.7